MKHWTTENREAAKGRDWAIETRELTKEFDGERAVDGLDLIVPEGSVFGLMGPNGAGKSTIIRMLMGIILPTSGTGTILGREITDPSGTVRQDVGYVADFQHMYPFFRVEEILQFCARYTRAGTGSAAGGIIGATAGAVMGKSLLTMMEFGSTPVPWVTISMGITASLAIGVLSSAIPALLARKVTIKEAMQ